MPLIRYRTGDFARLSKEHANCIERVYGRVSAPAAFYALQEKLCPLKEILDYNISISGEMLNLEAIVSNETVISAILSVAAEAFGMSENNVSLSVKVSSPLEGKMFTLGKRTI